MNKEFETDFLIKSCKLFSIYATSDAITPVTTTLT